MLTFNGVGLFVTDLEKMVAFYQNVMRMTVKRDWPEQAELFSGSMRITMYSRKNFEIMVSSSFVYPKKLNGTMELSFSLPYFQNVDEEYKRVVEAGARPVFPPQSMPWGQRTSFVADPDGNLIEIGSFNHSHLEKEKANESH